MWVEQVWEGGVREPVPDSPGWMSSLSGCVSEEVQSSRQGSESVTYKTSDLKQTRRGVVGEASIQRRGTVKTQRRSSRESREETGAERS